MRYSSGREHWPREHRGASLVSMQMETQRESMRIDMRIEMRIEIQCGS